MNLERVIARTRLGGSYRLECLSRQLEEQRLERVSSEQLASWGERFVTPASLDEVFRG